MGFLDSFEQGVEMQIKIVTLLVLSATFLCLVSCGGSNQSEIAIPATFQEISGESEAITKNHENAAPEWPVRAVTLGFGRERVRKSKTPKINAQK